MSRVKRRREKKEDSIFRFILLSEIIELIFNILSFIMRPLFKFFKSLMKHMD
ncbi:hypothetical protein KLEB273_gp131 [Bacillus phage vB_BauM_KLEB27-3]|nr:hypothetical protein KLEB273_gp131 [Bacillus phage vB_BauM_KLEB27-3]